MPITSIQDQLARDEGRRLMPYEDTRDNWTIGIGHKLGGSVPPQFIAGITDDQCNQLFDADLHHVWDMLDAYLPWWQNLGGTQDPRGNVLVNMAFNLGCAGLSHFTTFLGLMRARSWQAAADDLRATTVYRELTNRYERLAVQIESGEWQ